MFNSFPEVSYEVQPIEKKQFVLTTPISKSLLLAWYSYLRHSSIVHADPRYRTLLHDIYSFFDIKSEQFPPDPVKCARLFCILQDLAPTLIIELGCGTSSRVLSSYLSTSSLPEVSCYTYDDSADWLLLTQKKLQSSTIDARHHFKLYTSDNDLPILKSLNLPPNVAFIYLDASFDDRRFQGLNKVLFILQNYTDPFVILIDSRWAAVRNLHKLALEVSQVLHVRTTCRVPDKIRGSDKSLYISPNDALHGMIDYTLVSNSFELLSATSADDSFWDIMKN